MISQWLTQLTHSFSNRLSDPTRRLQLSVTTLIGLLVYATAGYMILEGMNFVDALYMTVITVATVGYGDVVPRTEAGRIFTITLIVLGIGLTTTAISTAFSIAMGPKLWLSVQQKRMKYLMQDLNNHYIVCGYGRIGRQIIRDLQARNEQFVLVDSSPELEERLLEEQILVLIGDATRDEVLIQAGIERARGLVSALSSDPDNLMTVLTARGLNPELFITARVIYAEAESKLRRAGANRVINPYQIGGHRMALSLLRPAVDDFLDLIFHFGEGDDVDVGQFLVREGSRFDGQTVGGCDLRREHNINILAIKQADGELIITPNPHTVLQANAILIVIGPPSAIYQLERINMDV